MRIYTRIILDIASGDIIAAESYEYSGPVASCDPVTLSAAISTAAGAAAGAGAISTTTAGIISGAAALTGAVGSLVQGIGQANYAEGLAKAEAKSAEMAAREEANRIRRRGDALLGTQRAVAGAQGTTLEGSPLLVMEVTAREIELDAQSALYKGKLKAFNSRLEGAALRNYHMTQGLEGMGGSILSSFTGFRSGMKFGTEWAAGGSLLTS